MAITGFTSNLSGRTLDINVLRVTSYTDNQTQATTVEFGNPSQFITGIVKLVQKYAILFLTQVGTQINYPDFGTNFLTTLQQGSSGLSRLNVLHLFNFANLDVLGILKLYQSKNPTIPSDEQLQSATLESFSYSGTTLSLSINITSVAGDSLILIVPVPLVN